MLVSVRDESLFQKITLIMQRYGDEEQTGGKRKSSEDHNSSPNKTKNVDVEDATKQEKKLVFVFHFMLDI